MRALVVDDHMLIRSGLHDMLASRFPEIEVVEAASGELALGLIGHTRFDLAIIDLFIPGEAAFVFVRKLCDADPELPVLVLSGSENPVHVRKCIDLGCSAFVPKSAAQDTLFGAIDSILDGGVFIPTEIMHANAEAALNSAELPVLPSVEAVTSKLTDRQLEILTLITSGKSNKQIARDFQLSENTVKVHVSAILRSLGLDNRTQAGILGQQLGLLADAATSMR